MFERRIAHRLGDTTDQRSTAAYQAPGDTKGDGIGGVWHLAKP